MSRRGLEGRVAIVTGGSDGLGKEFAHGLAEAGARVVVAARRAELLEQVAAELRDAGFGAQCGGFESRALIAG